MAYAQVAIILCMVHNSLQHGNGHYHKAAVATDNPQCSEIGKGILEQGGSVVDAAITSLLCVGVVNPQSSGLGGGLSMVVYMDKQAEALLAMERVPLAADPNMFKEKVKLGVKGIAVPGQLSGLWEAHQRYGKLPWKKLFEPVLEIARNGHLVTKHLENILNHFVTGPQNASYTEIIEMFSNEDGSLMKEGDTKTSLKYADTLEKIANNGPWEFYMGDIGKGIVKDIQDQGGIITEEDLCPCHMQAQWKPVASTTFKNGLTMLATPMAGSGPMLMYLLNVLDEFNITSESVATPQNRILLYHRFLEAIKFAINYRYHLGDDPESIDVKNILTALKSKQFAQETRALINDAKPIPYPEAYSKALYKELYEEVEETARRSTSDKCGQRRDTEEQSGDTSHISILAENGDAVSVTTSIGYYFGSGIYSKRTGIFFNNHMTNFVYPGCERHPNSIKPGRLFFTGTTPSILVDDDRNVKMVIGSSGGQFIIPINAWVILRTLWTGSSLQEAIDEKRIYAASLGANIELDMGVDDGTIDDIRLGLENMGHVIKETPSFAVVQAIFKHEQGDISAYSDLRKGGWAAGY